MTTAPIKVYLDDERATPAGWTRVHWPDEKMLIDIAVIERGHNNDATKQYRRNT